MFQYFLTYDEVRTFDFTKTSCIDLFAMYSAGTPDLLLYIFWATSCSGKTDLSSIEYFSSNSL